MLEKWQFIIVWRREYFNRLLRKVVKAVKMELKALHLVAASKVRTQLKPSYSLVFWNWDLLSIIDIYFYELSKTGLSFIIALVEELFFDYVFKHRSDVWPSSTHEFLINRFMIAWSSREIPLVGQIGRFSRGMWYLGGIWIFLSRTGIDFYLYNKIIFCCYH